MQSRPAFLEWIIRRVSLGFAAVLIVGIACLWHASNVEALPEKKYS